MSHWLLLAFLSLVNGQSPLPSPSPSPLTIPTNGAEWAGLDWSTIEISIGNPPQLVRLIPSTGTSKILVLDPSSCPGTVPSCDAPGNARGGSFNSVLSSSYRLGVSNGVLDLLSELYPESANESVKYGTDTVTIRKEDGQGIINATDIIIGSALQVTPLEMVGLLEVGMLGIGPRLVPMRREGDANTTTFPGLVTWLYDEGVVPSRSWAYNAGAYNKGKGIPADLIVGGYNSALIAESELNSTFALDESLEHVLTLNSLTVAATGNAEWGSGSQDLLTKATGGPILIKIDSTTPYLWLPEAICEQFEAHLGLVWDPTVKMYLLGSEDSQDNDSSQDKTLQGVRDDMKKANVSFTFTLSDGNTGDVGNQTNVISIVVTYDSFNLRIPYSSLFVYANSTSSWYTNITSSSRIMNYFPLKRADRQEQYTLGRAFLQEAYLITNYHQNTFQVHQRVFDSSPRAVVPILPNPGSAVPSNQSPLSTKKIIGIVVGICIGILLICIGLTFYYRWKKSKPEGNTRVEPGDPVMAPGPPHEYYGEDVNGPPKVFELDTNNTPSAEGQNNPHIELARNASVIYEMSASRRAPSQGHGSQGNVVNRQHNHAVEASH